MAALDLTSKTAIVTGGGSGIGKAISIKFAEQGAKVHILELKAESGEQTVAEIRDKGFQADCHSCDVSDQKAIRDLINTISKNSPIDILVNNAGIAHVGNLENTEPDDMDRLYKVNIKGVYNCMFASIGIMKKQGHGVILNMASIASSVGISDRFAYSMTK